MPLPHPVLVVKETHRDDATRWESRPGLAALLRAFVLIAPIATPELPVRLYVGQGDHHVALTLQHPTTLTLTTP